MIIRTVLAIAAMTATFTGVGIAQADKPNHEVPTWMRQTCASESDTNCYWPGGSFKPDQGEMYVREMPGKRLVCVFYVTHPRRDYCERVH